MTYYWLILLMLVAFVGCDSKPTTQTVVPGQPRTARVQLGSRSFLLEIAADQASRERGLMYRKSLPEDAGMLFVFEQPDVLEFWMRNTYIPLDIVYLDAAGKVVTIRQMKPLDEATVSSEKSAKFAIELNEGAAKAAGVREGDTVALPDTR